jgi:hypothetical protein
MSTSVLAAWSFDDDDGWRVYLCRFDVVLERLGLSELVRGTSAMLGRPVVILGVIYHPKSSQFQMLLPKPPRPIQYFLLTLVSTLQ